MPSDKRPNVKPVIVEYPLDLHRRAREFCAARGEKFADVARAALERHLAYPPPVPAPPPAPAPFPDDATAPAMPAKSKRAKKAEPEAEPVPAKKPAKRKPKAE